MGIDLAQISEQHFSVAVRGWNRDEVRDFLREVAASFVPLLQERDKLRRLEAAHRAELDRLAAEVERLRAEAEGYRSRGVRTDLQQSGIFSDIGG